MISSYNILSEHRVYVWIIKKISTSSLFHQEAIYGHKCMEFSLKLKVNMLFPQFSVHFMIISEPSPASR